MNIFRLLADVSHTLSKCILIWAIHSNKSAEGVSLVTQLLYIAVFTTRYLDLFWVPPQWSWWNFILKNFYIWSSIYIIILMTRIYARTREREKAWKLGGYATGGSLVLAPFVCVVFKGWKGSTVPEMLWTFSIVLESVCVLPQLLLLRQTTVPTVIDSYYLLLLGLYRVFYIINWIYRGATERFFEPTSVIFGIIQTAFYIDFAWVYWTRQRVKLRGGGVVDSDDLRKGWLVNRVLGGTRASAEIDEEEGAVFEHGHPRESSNGGALKSNRWGARGVSVSADDTVEEHQRKNKGQISQQGSNTGLGEGTAMLAEDDDLFSDDEGDDASRVGGHNHAVLNSGQEWGDGRSERGVGPDL